MTTQMALGTDIIIDSAEKPPFAKIFGGLKTINPAQKIDCRAFVSK